MGVKELRGVESIVGAFMAVMAIVGLILGFYAWIGRSSESVRDQLSDSLERLYYLSYPPTLSLKYDNGSLKLVIRPYLPLNVSEVVVRSRGGGEAHAIPVNALVADAFEVELPGFNGTVDILVVSSNGVIYYYVPRQDPSLASAPDSLRSLTYVNKEIVEYLNSTGSGSKRTWAVLPVGFKLHVAASASTSALTEGPALRGYVPDYDRYRNRNFNVEYFVQSAWSCRSYPTVLTQGRTQGSLDTCCYTDTGCGSTGSWSVRGDTINISSNGGYVQVYRVIRAVEYYVVEFNATIRIEAGSNVTFIPVVYVYDATYSLTSPVTFTTLAQNPGSTDHWIQRLKLEPSLLNARSWVKTYSVKMNLAELAMRETYILVGVEALAGSLSVTIVIAP